MVSKRGSPKRSPKKSIKRSKRSKRAKGTKGTKGSPSLNNRIFTASMFVNSAERPKFKTWITKNRSKLHPSMPPSKIISLYKRSKKGSKKLVRGGNVSASEIPIKAGLTSLEKGLVFGTGTGLLTNNKGLGLGVGLGTYFLDRLNNQSGGSSCACGK